jgi:hypothetical protein
MADDKKNCYDVILGVLRYNMCNVGSWVGVGIRSPDYNQNSVLTVQLVFNGKTLEGWFDCPAVEEATQKYAEKYPT